MLRQIMGPKWVALHATVLVAVVVMVNLGFWQLDRHDERRELNAAVRARTGEPVVPLGDLVAPSAADPRDRGWRDLEWRRVTVSGRYDPAEAVSIVNRSVGGTAGVLSLVPLRLDDGQVILVDRGFVPLALEIPAPPDEQVEIEGFLRVTQTRGTLGAIDSSDTTATEFQRVDLGRLAEQIEGTMAPMWLQARIESPASNARWPAPVGLPDLSEGPHLGYAGQWFFFCLVAIVGWIVVVRRGLRTATRPSAAP